MPAPKLLAGLPKPLLFGLYGAVGGLLGAILLGEPAWRLLKPPEAYAPPQLAVGASSSVKVYPGTSNSLIVRVARERFDGPVAIKFSGMPEGVALPDLTVQPGEVEVKATLSAAANVPTGLSKIAIRAEARDGSLDASTTTDLEVTGPPPAIAVTVPASLAVYTRGTGRFTTSIARRGYDGEVPIRVESLPTGVTAEPATIPRGGNEVEVTLKAAGTTPVKASKLTVVAEAPSVGLKAAADSQLDVLVPPIAPVDIVFVLDVTASMQWALNDLKNGIVKFAESLSKAQVDFRLALVTFQDVSNPGEKVEVVKFDGAPFTKDAVKFQQQVGQLRAAGGGDIPESSLEGVEEAVKLPFRQGATRMLLVITDAPPKVVPEGNTPERVRATATQVRTTGIDSVHVVVDQLDKASYDPLREAGTLKDGGKYFDIRELVRVEGGFDSLLDTFGRDVTAAAMARSTDAKPQVAPPPPPPRVGASADPKAAEAPPVPTIQGVQASGQFASGTEKQLTLAIGVWTGAIAGLLCLALMSGQYHYLRGQFPPVPRAIVGFVGGFLVGTVGGAAGQGLYMIGQGGSSLGPVFQVLGWALLGGLAGLGLSLFIPNMKWTYGLAGGAIGGAVAAGGYLAVRSVAPNLDLVGRLVGGLILGFSIGLMVAIVEAAFRRAWLEVRYGSRETITVNLGPEPVKIGGDARMCTVWARGAAPLALRFFLRDGKVICDDITMKREGPVADGFAKEVGNVTVTVRTGSGTTASPASAPRPASPPPAPKPAASSTPLTLDDDFDALPMPMSPPPASPPKPQPPARPPAPSRPAIREDDDFDLPQPISPLSPPAAPSRPAAPPAPVAARPAPPVADKPRPPAPTAARPQAPPPKPPSPAVPAAAKPAAPPPASPPPPAAPPAAKHPDACPTCGRVNPGKPKTRYCMVCDQTY
jgi:hypothetical protein